MIRNIRGRLARLEKAVPATGTSIMTNGVFWAMLCGEPGEYTPAELAEWQAVWQAAKTLAAGDQARSWETTKSEFDISPV